MSSIRRSLEKARRPAKIEPVTNSEPEKAKSVPGFEPGLLGQNATAVPLAPPPRPLHALPYTSTSFVCWPWFRTNIIQSSVRWPQAFHVVGQL